jgi:hypothetical protein
MNDTPLDRLASRASSDPYFLGFRLAQYARIHDLDDDALATRLGCGPDALPTVRLCRAPRSDRVGFREDILCVATKFGLNSTALAEAAKFVPATVARTETADPTPSVMIAARDRDEPL